LRTSFVSILCIRRYLSRLTLATYGLILLQVTPVTPPTNPLYVFNTVPDFLRSTRFSLPLVEPAIICLKMKYYRDTFMCTYSKCCFKEFNNFIRMHKFYLSLGGIAKQVQASSRTVISITGRLWERGSYRCIFIKSHMSSL